MKVRFQSKFAKDLTGKEAAILKRVSTLIEHLESVTSLEKIPQLKKLKGFHHYYRIKIGDYRVGIKWEDNEIVMERFLHRKEIYRYFP